MSIKKRVTQIVVVLALVAAAFTATAPASAHPVQNVGVSAADPPCDVAWIPNPQMGIGLYARPDPPGPFTWTWTIETRKFQSGPRVLEVQCLLRFLDSVDGRNLWPGPADGQFGNGTERAVKAAQAACQIGQDGVVGPLTWTCLRRTIWLSHHPDPV